MAYDLPVESNMLNDNPKHFIPNQAGQTYKTIKRIDRIIKYTIMTYIYNVYYTCIQNT